MRSPDIPTVGEAAKSASKVTTRLLGIEVDVKFWSLNNCCNASFTFSLAKISDAAFDVAKIMLSISQQDCALGSEAMQDSDTTEEDNS